MVKLRKTVKFRKEKLFGG